MTFGHNQGWDCSGCDGRAHGVPLLVLVGAAVPAPPYFGWSKHASTTAHISEGTLARSVSTSTTYTWNTCHGTTSTPGFGACLMTCVFVDCVWLATVLAHVGMHKVDQVNPDGSFQDSWQLHMVACFFILIGVDRYQRSGCCNRHF